MQGTVEVLSQRLFQENSLHCGGRKEDRQIGQCTSRHDRGGVESIWEPGSGALEYGHSNKGRRAK